MKVISRDDPKILAEIIYQIIKEYAKTQLYGVSFEQVNEALSLVANDLNYQTVLFLGEK